MGSRKILKVQDDLEDLRKTPCPVRFELSGNDCVVEIQYFVTQKEVCLSEAGEEFLVIAVTTDGWDLLVGENLLSDSIFQREINDIDSIDVTISELLMAKHVCL